MRARPRLASSAISVPTKEALAPTAPAPLTCRKTCDAWAPPVTIPGGKPVG